MKKLSIIFFCGLFGCLSVSSQETAMFHILKIQRMENGCYQLTAKSNGEKYTIYSHYDENEKSDGEKIQRHDDVEMTIIPFFETVHVSLAEFKNGMGIQVNAEDSTRFVDVTVLNGQHLYSTMKGD